MWEVMSFGERLYWDMSNQDVSISWVPPTCPENVLSLGLWGGGVAGMPSESSSLLGPEVGEAMVRGSCVSSLMHSSSGHRRRQMRAGLGDVWIIAQELLGHWATASLGPGWEGQP